SRPPRSGCSRPSSTASWCRGIFARSLHSRSRTSASPSREEPWDSSAGISRPPFPNDSCCGFAPGSSRMCNACLSIFSTAAASASIGSARVRALFAPLVDLLEIGGTLVVLAAGTWELKQGRLTLGALLIFVTYLGKLYRPVRELGSFYTGAFTAAASAERVLELL